MVRLQCLILFVYLDDTTFRTRVVKNWQPCERTKWDTVISFSTTCLYLLIFLPYLHFYLVMTLVPSWSSPPALAALFLTLVALLHMYNLAGSKTNKIFNLQSTDGTFRASETVNLVRLTSWSLAEGREEREVQQVSCKAKRGKYPLSALLGSESR